MPYHAAVLYPNDEDVVFDENYYVQDHLPRAEKTWKKHGIISWQVIKYDKGWDGSRSKYLIGALFVWDTGESLNKALQDPDTAKLFEDGPNFTNKAACHFGWRIFVNKPCKSQIIYEFHPQL